MVSVILTTYNRAQLVMESIYSVLNQTYADLELIIVDDGSTDTTEELVNALPDPRIRYYKMPHTGRTAVLKNAAIRHAKGNLIAFIDSDDTWMENKLEKQVQLLNRHPEIGFTITDAITFRSGKVLSPRTYTKRQGIEYANIFNRLTENRFVVYNPTLVMRRSCVDKTGWFNEDMLFCSDYHFNMRLAYYFAAGIIYESLIWRRMHDNNRTTSISVENYEGFVQTFEYLYQRNMVSKKYLQKAKSHAYLNIGHAFKQQQNLPAARHHYWQSLKYNLLQPFCYWQLLTTFRA
ncbi:glycosyltransferase family 2 protein [Niastella sp. OAS944]|uniref:glycosyltransferase family 2 protein n=1 Tax=Niastella sp. OAS944 TaxID=2664089 RepID=UPI00348D8024|nr:glycosyltransferase involved in cell wall biosynthesis [Chitinophagaceae bacterium OAS944]